LFDKQKLEGIGLLAGGIAHDFNNILVAIMGNASLAQEMVPESSPLASVLGEIVGASERAAHLTRQVLAYSGKGRFVVEPLDMSAMVVDMARLVQPLIPSRVDLRLDLADRLPAVEADAGQMQQVVMNLVINAAEAIGDRQGSVWVRTGVRDVDSRYIQLALQNSDIEPGPCVFLEVRDTGCGMDEATLTRIFDPFFTTKFTGRGLGLAAVAGIVRGHKGAIRVASQPDQGSTFLVLFPALTSPAPAGVATRNLVPADCAGAGIILVVDDERMVLHTARMALERHGYTVREAASGPEAIEALQREKAGVAAVILDLSMPGMSGQEALPLLRQIQPSLRVIVSSGYSQSETLQQFSGQPISGFIQKPYTSARLAESVKAALAAGGDSGDQAPR
jgi:CheY-like chemotaxis protein